MILFSCFPPGGHQVDDPLFVSIEIARKVSTAQSQRIAHVLGHEPWVSVQGAEAHFSTGHWDGEVGDGVGLGPRLFLSDNAQAVSPDDRNSVPVIHFLKALPLGFRDLRIRLWGWIRK